MHMRKALMLVLGLFMLCTQLLAQNRTVTGTVTDEKGSGVPNASVTVKGSKVGTTTNADGTFSLSVPNNAKTVVISSIGFQSFELALSNQSTFKVSLSTAAEKSMDE